MKKNILLMMPDNPIKPYGGEGVKWAKIIDGLKDEYYFYVIGMNHDLLDNGTRIVESENYTYYSTYYVENISDSSKISTEISTFISEIDFVICVDTFHYQLMYYIINKYNLPFGYCFDGTFVDFKNKDFFIRDEYKFLISCSDYSPIVEYLDLDKNDITIIHNGIDFNDFDNLKKIDLPGSHTNKILFVGRPSAKEKNFGSLCMCKMPLDTDLVVVGKCKNDYYDKYIYGRLHCNNNIINVGYISGVDRFNYMYSADAVIVPSITEPFGIVCLEALYCGTRLITTLPDGMRSWLPEEYIIKSDPDTYSLERAMKSVVYDKVTPISGKDFVKNFSIEKMILKYREILNEHINKNLCKNT